MKTTNSELDECLKDALVTNDVEWLKKNKDQFDINYRFKDCDNDTLLSYSISDHVSNAYLYLLQNGADIYAINDEGETIFHSIVFSGIPDRIDTVLKFDPNAIKLINTRSNDGTTPLLSAVLMEDYFMCSHLLDLGADVNIADNENNAPIHPACSMGNLDIVKLLVNYNARLHIKTAKGNFPLALAINGEHENVAKFLLSYTDILSSKNKKS